MATPSDRLARVIVKYEVDRASAQAVANSAASVSASLRSVGLAANTVGAQADQLRASFASIARQSSLDKLAAEMSLAAQQGQSLDSIILKVSADLHRLDANAAEVDRLAHAFNRAEKEARDLAAAEDALLDKQLAQIGNRQPAALFQGGRLQGGALGRLGSELRLLPSVPIPGTGFGTDAVANLLRISGAANTVFQSMGASIQSMGVAAGVAAPAILGVVAAFQAFNNTIKEGKLALDAALAAQQRYYDALSSLTTAQGQLLVIQLQGQQELLKQQIAETTNSLLTGIEGAQPLTDAAANLASLFNPAFGTDAVRDAIRAAGVDALAPGLADKLRDLAEQFLANEGVILRVNSALDANLFAANDARTAVDRIRASLEELGFIEPPSAEKFADFAIGLAEGAAALPDKVRDF